MGILKGSFTTFLLLLLRGGPEPGVKLGSEDSGRQGPGRSERVSEKGHLFQAPKPRVLFPLQCCMVLHCALKGC